LKLTTLKVRTAELSAEISTLSLQKKHFVQVKGSIDKLFETCVQFRRGSQIILQDLLQAQMALSRVIMKIEEISVELSECSYAIVRRDIAVKLRKVVKHCKTVDEIGLVSSHSQMIDYTLESLGKLDRNTGTMLRILASPH
jgi:hypothetical protein